MTEVFNAGDKVEMKVGDKVRFTGDNSDWLGLEGIITGLKGTNGRYNHTIRITKPTAETTRFGYGIGRTAHLRPSDLEVIPNSILFKDIKKGDTIKRTNIMKGGTKEVREGTVDKISAWCATSENYEYILAYDTDDEKGSVTLELLNRPEPVKRVWEDAKVGDVFMRTGLENAKDTSTITRVDAGWLVTYGNREGGVFTGSFDLTETHLFDSNYHLTTKV